VRCLIDTNVIISALFRSGGVPDLAVKKAFAEHEAVICEYTITELYDVFGRKWKSRLPELTAYLEDTLGEATITNPDVTSFHSFAARTIRDKDDAPILAAALALDVDYIITGDKDFLSLDMSRPKAITPADFLSLVR